MRFEEREDCWVDTVNGLEWAKQDSGKMDWAKAKKTSRNGWKLPSIDALVGPYYKIKEMPPGMVMGLYWSSTEFDSPSDLAWALDLENMEAIITSKLRQCHVRLARVRL